MKLARIAAALLPGLGMAVLILDGQTALAGAKSGLELCLGAVIPSLFPFLFLSVLLTGNLLGRRMPLLRPLGRLCRIPAGSESLLCAGLLGGYPVGAQCVAQAWREGTLSTAEARRMLGFCSNAGPSFLFGILAGAFSRPLYLWTLWAIHILSALSVGVLLPGGGGTIAVKSRRESPSPTRCLTQSVRVMGSICGWVILFRVLLAFLDRWFLWRLPTEAGMLIGGLLELTNGCCSLSLVDREGLRFLLASLLLGWGGVCVGLQTRSVTGTLGTGLYFPGKALQAGISLILAWIAQWMLFPAEERFIPDDWIPGILLFSVLLGIGIKIIQKPVAIWRVKVYNEEKQTGLR